MRGPAKTTPGKMQRVSIARPVEFRDGTRGCRPGTGQVLLRMGTGMLEAASGVRETIFETLVRGVERGDASQMKALGETGP